MGNSHDRLVIDHAARTGFDDGTIIRHASAPGLLLSKWGAFRDRGLDDPLCSHDLEDIVALIAARPTLHDELSIAAADLRVALSEVVSWCMQALDLNTLEDAVDAHLAHVDRSRRPIIRRLVIETIREWVQRTDAGATEQQEL